MDLERLKQESNEIDNYRKNIDKSEKMAVSIKLDLSETIVHSTSPSKLEFWNYSKYWKLKRKISNLWFSSIGRLIEITKYNPTDMIMIEWNVIQEWYDVLNNIDWIVVEKKFGEYKWNISN